MTETYVELHARSAFSFLQGASLPEELVETAANLGYPALALLDRDGVYGSPRFHLAAKKAGIRAHIGAEITCTDGYQYPLLVENRTGYQNLCRLVTRMKLRAKKGEGAVSREELAEFTKGLVCLAPASPDTATRGHPGEARAFGGDAATRHDTATRRRGDAAKDTDAATKSQILNPRSQLQHLIDISGARTFSPKSNAISAARKKLATRRRLRRRGGCRFLWLRPMAFAMPRRQSARRLTCSRVFAIMCRWRLPGGCSR